MTNKGKLSLVLIIVLLLTVSARGIVTSDAINSSLPDLYDYSKSYRTLTFAELEKYSTSDNYEGDIPPQITVFTHGYDGNESHWSNNPENGYQFAKNTNSMIEKLRSKIGESNCLLFKAKTTVKIPDTDSSLAIAEVVNSSNNNSSGENSGDENLENPNNGRKSEDLCGKYLTEENTETRVTESHVTLYDLNNEYSEEHERTVGSLDEEEFSKHIIIIFSADYDITHNFDESKRGTSNDFVYAQLEFILDSITYQFRSEMGAFPTYNLIGHSRGGLTNMQYALAHPNNVASIYSMGTPYLGSDFGSLEIGEGNHFFISSIAQMTDNTFGIKDILCSDLYKSYRNLWNDNYEENYSHIKFKPIGTYVTMGFVLQLVIEFLVGEVGLGGFAEWGLRVAMAAVEAIILVGSYENPSVFSKNAVAKVVNKFKKVVNKYFGEDNETAIALVDILDNITITSRYGQYPHISYSIPSFFYIEDDLFIDLESQIASGYIGAEPALKLMDTIDQMEGGKAVNNYGVAHNLETHDDGIIRYVVNDIEFGAGVSNEIHRTEIGGITYIYRRLANNQIKLLGVSTHLNSSSVSIPESIGGGSVVAINLTHHGMSDGSMPRSIGGGNTPITHLTIPETVSKIDEYAFANMTSLEEVTINSSSISIGAEAFAGCSSLESVDISSGTVTSIGYGAFANCENLTQLEIPNTVTEIGDYAFYNNSDLTSVTFAGNSSLSKIGVGAFAGCSSLSSITIPATVTEIGDYAFYNSDLTSVTFAENSSLSKIGNGAFVNSGLNQTLNLPSSITHIGDNAFMGCSSLTIAELPENLISLGSFAFSECNLPTNITIPAGVEYIGEGAFYNCNNLTSITVSNQNEKFEVVDGVLFATELSENNEEIKKYLHSEFLGSTISNYTVPEGVTEIGGYAFAGNQTLTSITLSSGLKSIGDGAFKGCGSITAINIPASVEYIASGAFEDCSSLSLITVDSANVYYASENGVLFNKDKTYLHTYPMAQSQTSYSVPTTVTEIGDSAFIGNSQLVSINLNSVEKIGKDAFKNCSALVTISGDSVKSVKSSAFYGTPWYSSSETNDFFGIGKVLFKYNGSYSEEGLIDLRAYASIEEKAFVNVSEDGEYLTNSQLKMVYLGEELNEINALAFFNCISFESIYVFNHEFTEINNITTNFSDNVEIFVKNSLYNDFKSEYEEITFTKIQTEINYYLGETIVYTGVAYWGEQYESEYTPTFEEDDYNFMGWYDSTEYTNTFVGYEYSGFTEEDCLYAKIIICSHELCLLSEPSATGHLEICSYCGHEEFKEHRFSYEFVNNMSHKQICPCGYSNGNSPHVFMTTDLTYCVGCNTRITGPGIGEIIHPGWVAQMVTANGSYILPNGCIVLVSEDVAAYFSGTLVFYDASNPPQTA